MLSAHDIYLWLPRPLQNLALSVKGAKERGIRFGGIYQEYRELARSNRGRSREYVREQALARLNDLMELARTGTEFYPRFWPGNTPRRLSSLDQLQEFPILSKQAVREANLQLRCTLVKTPIVLQTTGTTGTPIRVFSTVDGRRRNYAFFDDYLEANGLDSRGRRVVLGGRVLVPASASKYFWRTSSSTNTMYLSSYHISQGNAGEYAKAIMDYQPEYIEAYPSAIGTLAIMLLEQGVEFVSAIPVVTSAESLLEHREASIKSVFRGNILDQYGAAEMSVFAERCPYGQYHAREDYALVEVLDQDGRDVGPGGSGRVVCSGLVNEGMPLVRYDMGDIVEVARSPCECGWDTLTWSKIIGRQDDVVWTPSGKAVGRLSPVLKGFPIREAQFVQEHVDEIRLLIVPGTGFDSSTQARVRHEVSTRLGDEVDVRIELVDGIPKGPGGKIRAVISSLSGPRTQKPHL